MADPNPRSLVATLLLSSVLACSGGEAATVRGARGSVVDSSAGTVALGLASTAPYSVALPAEGAGVVLEGIVRVASADSAAVRDSVVAVNRDQAICGDSATVMELRPSAGQGAIANALVWIEGIGAGKPLPEIRRDKLTIQNCRFVPRIMAVPVGSTINVFSADRVEHDARFYREGAGEPVDHVRTFNAGSLVPSEKIASEPGIVEVRSRFQPWARGYIAVFNHPYFAVTDSNGTFRIDGLPPGTYTVKVWHEGLPRAAEQRVTVSPTGTGRLDVAVPLG